MSIITFDNLSKSDGSALIDHNDTIVQASVFGPLDVSQPKMDLEEAFVEILYKPKTGVPIYHPGFQKVRFVENMLKSIFKEVILTRLHPQTFISILVQEIHDGGSLLSATVTAACCALMDAGIPMKNPVVGTRVKLDSCDIDFVFNNDLELVSVVTKGCVSEKDLQRAIESGRVEAKRDLESIRERVRTRFT